MPRKNWYSIQARLDGADKVVEIRIYDEIGFWGTTAKGFMEQLDAVAVDATRILVSINSPGGNVFDAFAIYNALLRHRLPVTTRVDGVAASAASLIFMAGEDRVMPENAMIMIHNPWTYAWGDADELRNAVDMLEKAHSGIVAAYARSGQSEDKISELMDATTWIDALEAQSMGFATLMEEPVKLAAHADTVSMLAQLNAPADLLAALQSQAEQPAPRSSEQQPETGEKEDADSGATASTQPEAESGAEGQQEPSASSSELMAQVFAQCRDRKIPHLAEAILLSCELTNSQQINARLTEAEQIASLCLAAKLQDQTVEFIKAGLNVEQVRSRLFDHVIQAAENVHISNLQRPDTPAPAANAGLHPVAIYAARKKA